MSSRRQSIFPSVPPRPTSCNSFSWQRNRSASQPLRRPSGQSSVGHKQFMSRRRPDFSDISNRRASCFSRLEAPVSKAPASVSPLAIDQLTRKGRSRMTPSPFLRGSSWQSQKGDTIQEVKETLSPLQCQNSSILDSHIGDTFISSESFSSLELRNSSGFMESFSELKKCKYIPSASTRFSDI